MLYNKFALGNFFFLFRFYFVVIVAFVDDLYGAWLQIQVPHDGLSEARSCLKSSTELSFSESESFRRFDQNQSHLCFEIEGNEAHDSRFHIFVVCALFSEYSLLLIIFSFVCSWFLGYHLVLVSLREESVWLNLTFAQLLLWLSNFM